MIAETDFVKLFVDLGLEIKPLGDRYTPDVYGKRLMAAHCNKHGVSYSSSTKILSQQNVGNAPSDTRQ